MFPLPDCRPNNSLPIDLAAVLRCAYNVIPKRIVGSVLVAAALPGRRW